MALPFPWFSHDNPMKFPTFPTFSHEIPWNSHHFPMKIASFQLLPEACRLRFGLRLEMGPWMDERFADLPGGHPRGGRRIFSGIECLWDRKKNTGMINSRYTIGILLYLFFCSLIWKTHLFFVSPAKWMGRVSIFLGRCLAKITPKQQQMNVLWTYQRLTMVQPVFFCFRHSVMMLYMLWDVCNVISWKLDAEIRMADPNW